MKSDAIKWKLNNLHIQLKKLIIVKNLLINTNYTQVYTSIHQFTQVYTGIHKYT